MARYCMPKPGDGLAAKVLTWARTGRRWRPRFPRAVQFQTMSTCNARCIFCPHHHSPGEIPHGRMDDALIRKIVDECARHFVGRVSPYLTNEPLLDKRMPEILAYIRRRNPWFVKTKINTNGSLLTADVGAALLEAGLDQLWVSVNGYSAETYRQSMALDLDKVLANIDGFLALKAQRGHKRPKVVITTLRTSIVEPELEYARRYWAGRDVTFKIHHMDNRAGQGVDDLRPASEPVKFKRNCDLFLKQAYIVENGDMIICCHDWKQTVVVGNMAQSSIAEVWNSKHFTDLIHQYFAQDFRNLEICRTCC